MLLWGVVVPRRGTKKSPQPIRAEAMVGIKGGLGRPEVTCQSLRSSDPTQVPQAICEETDCVAGGVLCGGDVSGVK